MNFFAPEKIGTTRRRTPDGYMLVEGTPIARTGIQQYRPEELGNKIAPGDDGLVHIERTPDQVFDPISVASFNGKPFTNEHPPELINPMTWRELSRGVVMNPRRGDGDDAGLLLVDLLVCDAGMIALIEAGKVELSCGYLCEYIETGPGRGEQQNIIGNHVALVSDGRCGSRCSISDHHPTQEQTMTLKEKLMKLVGAKDSAALQKALDEEMPESAEGGLVININGGSSEGEPPDPMKVLSDRMDAMEKVMQDVGSYVSERRAADKKAADEAAEKAKADEEEKKKSEAGDADTEEELEKEAPKGTGDAARKATDSQYLADAFQNTVAMAEILVPGVQAPTFDKAAKPKATLDTMTAFRRQALELAYLRPESRQIIDDLMAGKTFDAKTMDCGRTRDFFVAAATAQKRVNTVVNRNNNAATKDKNLGRITTIADLNRRASEVYGKARS